MARAKQSARQAADSTGKGSVRLYTLEVVLVSGPISSAFVQGNPVVSRTIQIRGDQTLEDLHHAIFTAFGRTQEQMYEFQFGKGPSDPNGDRYVLPGAVGMAIEGAKLPAGRVNETTIASLGLEVGQSFGYWFDFVADWWHRIRVQEIAAKEPRGTYPRVSRRVGENPPQDAGENLAAGEPQSLSEDAAADMSCLIGELHLNKGDYPRAIEAFSRAIAVRPTADAHHGRARAYRALAAGDERKAQELG